MFQVKIPEFPHQDRKTSPNFTKTFIPCYKPINLIIQKLKYIYLVKFPTGPPTTEKAKNKSYIMESLKVWDKTENSQKGDKRKARRKKNII